MLKNLNKTILLLCLLSVSACGGTKTIDIVTTQEKPIVSIPAKPREIEISSINVSVVTKQNINELTTQIAKNSTAVFIVLTPQDYENLVNNIGEIRRYITQQTTLLDYYETTIKTLSAQPEEKK